MLFSNQVSIPFFTNFCMINSTINLTVTQLQMFQAIDSQNSTWNYQYTHLLFCPQWYMWCWWDVLWMYSYCAIMEMRPPWYNCISLSTQIVMIFLPFHHFIPFAVLLLHCHDDIAPLWLIFAPLWHHPVQLVYIQLDTHLYSLAWSYSNSSQSPHS